MNDEIKLFKFDNCSTFFMLMVALQSCDKADDCTWIDKIGGGLLQEKDIKVSPDLYVMR